MPTRKPALRAGIHYHIFNRGVGGLRLFHSVENYLYFLNLLKQKRSTHEIVIVAYCLMPNHFHLLLRSEVEGSISPFMQGLCSSYAQGINHELGRQGPLFAGRFKAVAVLEEAYFVHLARYIHRNPLEARLVDRLGHWPFSNFREIMGSQDGELHDSSLVPERFPTPNQYRSFVNSEQVETPMALDRALT